MSNTSASLSAGREDGRTDRCCHPDEGGISSIGSLLPFTFFLGSSLRVIPTQEGSLTEPLPPAYNRFNKRRRPQLGSSAIIIGHLTLPPAIAYLRHAIIPTPMILHYTDAVPTEHILFRGYISRLSSRRRRDLCRRHQFLILNFRF